MFALLMPALFKERFAALNASLSRALCCLLLTAFLQGCQCHCPSAGIVPIAPASQPTPKPDEPESTAVIRAAIDLGLGRSWGPGGTGTYIPDVSRSIIENYLDQALPLLEHDLHSSDPIRRANAFDCLADCYEHGPLLERAAKLVIDYDAVEKTPWVKQYADQMVEVVRIKLGKGKGVGR